MNNNTLVLCSNHRLGGTYSEGTIELPEAFRPLRSDNNDTKFTLSLVYASIPNTTYVFNGDTFSFTEMIGPHHLSFTLTGSFTANSLALYLQQQMIAQSLASGHGFTYQVIYDAITGKMTFTETTPEGFRINAGSFSPSLAYKLGFNVADTIPNTTVTTPNILNLQPPKGCLIEFGGLSIAKKVLLSKDGRVGHFFVPLVGDSFAIADYYHKSMFENFVEFSDNVKFIKYRLLDAETRGPLLLQSDWIIVLNIS
jgi:hypothetical protein